MSLTETTLMRKTKAQLVKMIMNPHYNQEAKETYEAIIMEIYAKGHSEGYEEGHSEGYEEGVAEIKAELQETQKNAVALKQWVDRNQDEINRLREVFIEQEKEDEEKEKIFEDMKKEIVELNNKWDLYCEIIDTDADAWEDLINECDFVERNEDGELVRIEDEEEDEEVEVRAFCSVCDWEGNCLVSKKRAEELKKLNENEDIGENDFCGCNKEESDNEQDGCYGECMKCDCKLYDGDGEYCDEGSCDLCHNCYEKHYDECLCCNKRG